MHDDVPVRFMKQTVMKISAAIMLMMGGFQRHIRGSAEKEIDGINVTVAAEVDYNDKTESHIIHSKAMDTPSIIRQDLGGEEMARILLHYDI